MMTGMTVTCLSVPFDLSETLVGLDRAGGACLLEWSDGPPPNADGYTVSAPLLTADPPHRGEMHPDGDELLYLVSGRVNVALEEPDGERIVTVRAGEAFVVPRGMWHRVAIQEPSRLVHITPGPGGEHRPLDQSDGGFDAGRADSRGNR